VPYCSVKIVAFSMI